MEYADNSIISSYSRNVKSANWRKPDLGWYELNIDGAHKSFTGVSASEGVIRDWNREWVVGFSKLIAHVQYGKQRCGMWLKVGSYEAFYMFTMTLHYGQLEPNSASLLALYAA
ncbi:hypothetical protein GOBAR_DD25781 [Gossypium barbadense]|nr:hypothetical protein GOBAR_DD25781 [Gossypium barbadense]